MGLEGANLRKREGKGQEGGWVAGSNLWEDREGREGEGKGRGWGLVGYGEGREG